MMKSETIFSGRRAAPWLLGALLILRFPLLILGGTWAAAAAVYLVGTQLCTCLLYTSFSSSPSAAKNSSLFMDDTPK